jgi:hypothetical protein
MFSFIVPLVADHTMFLDLFAINLNTHEQVESFFNALTNILDPLVKAKGPIDMVVQYDGFDLPESLQDDYTSRLARLENDYYKSVHRYTGTQFHRAKLGKTLKMDDWDSDKLYDEFDTNKDGEVSLEELRKGIKDRFEIRLSQNQLGMFKKTPDSTWVDRDTFAKAIEQMLRMQ